MRSLRLLLLIILRRTIRNILRTTLPVFRMAVAVCGIAVSIVSLDELDQLKFPQHLVDTREVQTAHAKKMVEKQWADWEKSTDNKKLKQLISELNEAGPGETTWRQRLNTSGSVLRYAYELGVASCIALLTICILYLLYALAAWLRLPVETVKLSKLEPAEKAVPVAIGTAAAAKAGAASIAAMLAVAPTILAGAGVLSAIVLLKQPVHQDGKDGIDGKHGEQAPPVPPPPHPGQASNLSLQIGGGMADHKLTVAAAPSWISSTKNLSDTATALAGTANSLIVYGNTLRDLYQQNWDEVQKQLSLVAMGSQNLLESGRVAHQRSNSAMATLLARDCYRQVTEAYLLKSTLSIESEQNGLRHRMQKEPCAEATLSAQR